jgi:hypothetical protein
MVFLLAQQLGYGTGVAHRAVGNFLDDIVSGDEKLRGVVQFPNESNAACKRIVRRTAHALESA